MSATVSLIPDAVTASALLDVKAVAALLNCSTRHVRRLADRDAMPRPVRLGVLIRWRKADIEGWLSQGCPPAPRRRAAQ